MIEAWPDDIDVFRRQSAIVSSLAMGSAICVVCGRDHPECGRRHLESPWSIPPRCTDCGSVLRMPEHQQAA